MKSLVALLAFLLLAIQSPQAPAGTERIRGIVVQGETQRPAPNVRVDLRRTDYGNRVSGLETPCNPPRIIDDPKQHQYATTDANGAFTLQNIVPGRYYLIAEHEGYLRAEYGRREGVYSRGMVLEIGPQQDAPPPSAGITRGGRGIVAPARSSTTTVRPGMPSSVLENLTLRLFPAHTIAGRVHNEEGARVPAAVVQLYQYRFAPLSGRTLKAVRSIFTDDNGEFRLAWLNPGRYVVSAAYSDYVMQPWTEALRFTPNLPDPDNRYPVVFYPQAEKASEAFPVSVGALTAPPLDLKLWKRPRFNVQIRLVGASVPSGASVVLVPEGGDLCAAMDYGVAASNGEIVEIRDVPSGRYSMMAIRGRDSLSDVWPLIVDGDIRDYPLMVFPPVEIRIDKSADTGVRISLTRKGAVSDTRAAEHDSDGRFLFTGVGHGAYYVTAEPPAGYYVSDVIAYRLLPEDPRDPCTPPPPPAPMPRRVSSGLYRYLDPHGHLNKDMPFVVPNVIPGDVRCIGITWRLGGTLVGRVVDRTGNAVPGALVVGLPRSIWGAPDSDAAVTPPDRYLTTSTDNEGKFTLSAAVSDTEYKLFAFEDLDPNLVYDPALLNYFPNRDVIDIEDVAENTPVQRRVQQQQVLRSVTTRLCSENSLCVLKAISADETRSHNMGQ